MFHFYFKCRPIRRCYIRIFLCLRCRGKSFKTTGTIDYAKSSKERDVTAFTNSHSKSDITDLDQETAVEN